MFDHLQKLDPSGRTAWMDVPDISPEARLELRHAGETNRPYFNAMLKKAAARARQIGGRLDRVNANMLAQNRQEDRDMFPRYILVSWEGIEDDQGNPVEFDAETAAEFCQKCPAWIFDKIRNWAAAPENFMDDGQEPDPDPEELAGN